MTKENKLRKRILKLTKEYYQARPALSFVPGKSYINYAGMVYDEKEMVNLVDSSLDFWLTSGRYAKEFELKFAAYYGVKYCMLVNSGSSANLLAFTALTSHKLGARALKPGDEVSRYGHHIRG